MVVVGFGKSALDVAGEAAKFSKEVHLVYRRTHWPIPLKLLNLLDVNRDLCHDLPMSFCHLISM